MDDEMQMDLDAMVSEARNAVGKIKGTNKTLAVALFDLTGSVPLKLEEGHKFGTRSGLLHNTLCRLIVAHFEGTVVKELGDGTLCRFESPLSACIAAINVIDAVSRAGLKSKCSICLGVVEELMLSGGLDLIGTTVDRCARILSAAAPGQILLDRPLYEAVASFLKDRSDLASSAALPLFLKGYGNTEAYELAASEKDLQAKIFTPLTVNEHGRLTIAEKVAFLREARFEVIEFGAGLTTFSGYFHDRSPGEWKNHIRELLGRGVTIKCVAVDPEWPGARTYFEDRGELDYLDEVSTAIARLRRVKEDFERERLRGRLELYVYPHVPCFYACCVDPDEASLARIQVSNYLFGVDRSATPVMVFSSHSNPEMFQTYKESITKVLSDSKRLW